MLLTKNIKLKVGKLSLKFIGPFKILEYISESIYKLELLSLYKKLHLTFHVLLLEEYIPRKGIEPHQYQTGTLLELSKEDKDQEQEVEAIIDHKQDRRSKNRKYLIKQKDWPDDHNTWLLAYLNLGNVKELLDTYNRNHSLYQTTEILERSQKGHNRPLQKRRQGRQRT